jgi:hypothetical protein
MIQDVSWKAADSVVGQIGSNFLLIDQSIKNIITASWG